jgi:carbon-monoxide dehydrogenase catalytic subunit
MEFIQRKTADRAVNHFLLKAADQEITVAWDRFEGQLPECGFCESGLSCRDCLQGPCISHPFRDQSKLGVCGKDKDILAAQSLLRLVLKGTMSYLDQLNDFADGVQAGTVKPADKKQAEKALKAIVDLMHTGNSEVIDEFPAALVEGWKTAGIAPRGIANDIFKASQRLEGGIGDMEETLLWSFKTALLACMADRLQNRLKAAVFGDTTASELEVNLGILKKDIPSILFYGPILPLLKQKVAKAAKDKNVSVMGVCTDPLLPPYRFFPVTTYVSQEIPLMTGAVDLIVAGSQFVNPSLAEVAKDWKVTVVQTDGLNQKNRPLWGILPPMWTSKKLLLLWMPARSKALPFWPEATMLNTPRTKCSLQSPSSCWPTIFCAFPKAKPASAWPNTACWILPAGTRIVVPVSRNCWPRWEIICRRSLTGV